MEITAAIQMLTAGAAVVSAFAGPAVALVVANRSINSARQLASIQRDVAELRGAIARVMTAAAQVRKLKLMEHRETQEEYAKKLLQSEDLLEGISRLTVLLDPKSALHESLLATVLSLTKLEGEKAVFANFGMRVILQEVVFEMEGKVSKLRKNASIEALAKEMRPKDLQNGTPASTAQSGEETRH